MATMTVKPHYVVAATIAIALIAVAVFAVVELLLPGQTYSQFSAGGKTFKITYNAVNPQEWEKGLMNSTVTNSTFMLFVFGKPGIYSFWMYDTDYNLDIIWLNVTNGSGSVVYLASNVTGCFNKSECAVYTPSRPANYVLEAHGGFAEMNNITVGSVITLGN